MCVCVYTHTKPPPSVAAHLGGGGVKWCTILAHS